MTTTDRDHTLIVYALLALGALLVLPALLMSVGMMGFGMMGGGMWGGTGPASGWMWVVGALFQLLVLAAIVGLGYLGYRAVTGGDGGRDAAVAELREAYARGDVTDEEYERRLERLRDDEARRP